jgi:predicted aspartyl protease
MAYRRSYRFLGFIAAFAILGAAGTAYAQAPDTKPVFTESPLAPLSEATLQEFFIDRSNRMTVPVRINGAEPVPFVVDTGSERTVIANDLAKLLALEAGPALGLATISGRVKVNSFVIDSLTTSVIDIGGIEAPGLERSNIGAYGLLGIDSLEDRKVLLDFAHEKMEILPSPVRRGHGKLENGMIIVTAKRRAGRMILSDARINGFPVDIILDTGAQSSMGNAALREKLRKRDLSFEFKTAMLRSVTGSTLTGDFSQIKQIEIGGMTINNLPVTFTDNYIFGVLKLDHRPAILIGMDALQLFDRVVIDFANRRVAFDVPRSTGTRGFGNPGGSLFKN